MAKDLVMAQIRVKALTPDDMHKALRQTYTSLMALKAQEEAGGIVAVETPEPPSAPVDDLSGIWRDLQATVGQASQES